MLALLTHETEMENKKNTIMLELSCEHVSILVLAFRSKHSITEPSAWL